MRTPLEDAALGRAMLDLQRAGAEHGWEVAIYSIAEGTDEPLPGEPLPGVYVDVAWRWPSPERRSGRRGITVRGRTLDEAVFATLRRMGVEDGHGQSVDGQRDDQAGERAAP